VKPKNPLLQKDARTPLDFDLLYGKAFKVTDPEGNPNREGFSIVTPSNGGVFNEWKERPQFKEIVRKKLNEPDFLGDHKYKQIIESASKLGIRLASSKTALDALLEQIADEDYATHQHHSDPDFTTQNGKMMGKGTEQEQGALDSPTIPASSMIGIPNNFVYASYDAKKRKDPRAGDCGIHTASPVHELVQPVENEIEDATFFKEGDEDFAVSRVGGKIAVTQSYGTSTPYGVTPPVTNPNATPGVAHMTPEQRSQSAESTTIAPAQKDLQPPPGTLPQLPQGQQQTGMETQTGQQQQQPGQPTPPGQPVQQPMQPGMVPDPLEQLRQMTTSSVKLRLSCAVDKEFAPSISTVVKASAEALEMAGYTIHRATQKLSSLGASEGITLIVGHKKGSQVDVKDIARRVNGAVNPDYFVRTADIEQKTSPKSLPPRNDMRRHLDEGAKDEVKEGIADVPTPVPQQQIQAPPTPVPQQQIQAPPTAEQQLLNTVLATDKTAIQWDYEDDDEDDDEGGSMGTLYGKPLGGTTTPSIQDRLEYLRSQLQAESISQGELMELQDLADHIEPGDELLEAAGVPEFGEEEDEPVTPSPSNPKKYTPRSKFDKWFMDTLKIKGSTATSFPSTTGFVPLTEDGVNQVCPACSSQNVKKFENSDAEDGSLVECVDCGCFFAM
jgi:hypothetical protein